MWIMGKHFNNRAVSAVIATLLLIAIAVAAAIIVYVFSIGLLGGLQTSGGQQVKQQVILEAYSWPASGANANNLVLTLRNVGPAAVQFSDYFINGVAVPPSGGTGGTGLTACSYGTTLTTPLAVGSNCVAVLPATVGTTTGTTTSYSAGVAYVIKVVSVDGAVFSYSAIAGQSS
jgi:flagellin-like protein